MEKLLSAKHRLDYGYQHVWTGHMGKADLYKRSGPLRQLRRCDVPADGIDGEDITLRLKPMNCPSHMTLYNEMGCIVSRTAAALSEIRTLYRYEKRGELNGLARVRGLTQDDCHIFCMPDQIEAEILAWR